MMRTRLIMVVLTSVISLHAELQAGDIGFVEDFALAKDRALALKQLLPGTQDYYYYNCLHYQHTGQLDEVDKLMSLWQTRYGLNEQFLQIKARQYLLRYDRQPAQAMEYLITHLSLRYDHQRQVSSPQTQLPTQLDPRLISPQTLLARQNSDNPNSTNGLNDRGLWLLQGTEMNWETRRHLLGRITRPDYPGLLKLIVEDLDTDTSGGFGSLEIHKLLTLAQMDELLLAKPKLLNEIQFVFAYILRLAPNADVDIKVDLQARVAYLDRLWQFVSRLAPVHNSLKAHVLYHRLAFDRSQGIYDKQRFLTYVQLPRICTYIRTEYIESDQHQRFKADLNADFSQHTSYPVVALDEPLVRAYLLRFLAPAEDFEEFKPYINDIYLKHIFAEAKITAGVGDMEKWYSLLSPEQYKAIQQRVDIEMAASNKHLFAADEAVELKAFVKNVPTLIVKVYRINAMNYYRACSSQVGVDMDLDGLMTNHEATFNFKEPPHLRIERAFPLPELNEPGVYIVEFIGNGRSSRALVQKGYLHYLLRTGAAGQVFTVLDEKNKLVPDARLWIAGHEYAPDENGQIVVPFSNMPSSNQPVILSHGNVVSLDYYQQQAEKYKFDANLFVDRENLLKRRTAKIVVRPVLWVSGAKAPLELLEETVLVVSSTDLEGVKSVKEYKGLKLNDAKELTLELKVPENVRSFVITMKAKVKNLSLNKHEDLADSKSLVLNSINKSRYIDLPHLMHIDGQYVLELLGKTGEPQADRAVNVTLFHELFAREVHVSLRTDQAGRILLGELEGIYCVKAESGQPQVGRAWPIRADRASYQPVMNGKAGQPLLVPYMGNAEKVAPETFALFEMRGGTSVADHLSALTLAGGFLVIKDLPPGDYELRIKDDRNAPKQKDPRENPGLSQGTVIQIQIAQGPQESGYVLGTMRQLQTPNPLPLQIVAAGIDKDALNIRLANAGAQTRLVVVATRYIQAFGLFDNLLAGQEGVLSFFSRPPMSFYVSGRDIGDEYRYILDRRLAKVFPGNMLTRPGLLLNPWAINKTQTDIKPAQPGEDVSGSGGGGGGEGRGRAAFIGGGGELPHGFAVDNLDFLGQTSAVLTNLVPDKDGLVSIKLADLGAHQQIHILAMDSQDTIYRELSVGERKMDFLDLRLDKQALDPQQHFTEQKRITPLANNQAATIADIGSARFMAYDSLASAYRYYLVMNNDPNLAEFSFILNWPKLTPEQKREKYSKYACHELNLFLARKDGEFFAKVVRPYIASKKDKTFMDRFLLGEDLSSYTSPYEFGRLNAAEKVLLAQSIAGQKDAIARHISDISDLTPPDMDLYSRLFNTALNTASMDESSISMLFDRSRSESVLAPPAASAPGGPREGREAEIMMDKGQNLSESQKKNLEQAAESGKSASLKARKSDLDHRNFEELKQFYRAIDQTEEFAENNYYHVLIENQSASLVPVNAFWRDLAKHDGAKPFLSPNFIYAHANFTEILLALAMLDLPFEAPELSTTLTEGSLTLTASAPAILVHKEIMPAQVQEKATPILITQNFFQSDDRYRFDGNQKLDKYVTDEFLISVVYGCQIVVTNPTSTPMKLDMLLQVPKGALPVSGGLYTRGVLMDLHPYSTQTLEYFFYFPFAGKFSHYPIHVSDSGKLVGFAKPVEFNVVRQPSQIDKTSWDYISQNGTNDEVLAFLRASNIDRLSQPNFGGLEKIAWRMKDKEFFVKAIALLAQRHVYNSTLYSYGLLHNEPASAKEYLRNRDDLARLLGPYFQSKLVSVDPVERKLYQHLEYYPLVNARTHKLGSTRSILNDRLYNQYMQLMHILACKPSLNSEDKLAVTYYLLLQDRIEQGLDMFAAVNAKEINERIQYNYMSAYVSFYRQDTDQARTIASGYKDYGVDRWRKLFTNVISQLDEIDGKAGGIADKDDRDQITGRQAAAEPSMELKVDGGKGTVVWQNISAFRVNYFLMDVELLFSKNPFVQQQSGQFAYVTPNFTQEIKLQAEPKRGTSTFDLPEEVAGRNVLVEVVAGGIRHVQAYYANRMGVQVLENYGQVRIADAKGQAIAKVYVKVYARMKDGSVAFYKDGYTDIRGRFEYSSLSTDQLNNVARFAILILHREHGAAVREAAPPKQ